MIHADVCTQLTLALYAQASFGKLSSFNVIYHMYHISPTDEIKEVVSQQYTVSFYPMKTTGTGNYGIPVEKTCTIYGKGL